MSRSVLTVLMVFGMVVHSSGAQAGKWIDQFPQTSEVTLRDGSKVKLPLLIKKSSGVVLAGLANLDKLNSFLNPEGLRAVEVVKGKGLVMLFAMNYQDTSIGPYEELVVQVASTTRDHQAQPILSGIEDLASLVSVFIPMINGLTNDTHRETPFFMWKLFVTSPLALAVGREVWGYPKDMSSVEVRALAAEPSFSVKTERGTVVRAVRHSGFAPALPLSIDMNMISPRLYKQVLSHGIAQGWAKYSLFSSKTDTFAVDPQTEWGKNLAAVEFSPLLWQVMPQLEAVFFP